MASRVGLEIHRRLDEDQAPEDVAAAVKRSLSTVYFHKAGDCSCGNVEEPAPVEPDDVADLGDADDPERRIVAAYVAGVPLDRIAAAFGVPAEDIPRLADRAAIEQETEIMARLQRQHPARWASLREQRDRDMRKLELQGAVPVALVHEMLGKVRHITRALLASDHPNRFTDGEFWESHMVDLLTYSFAEIGVPVSEGTSAWPNPEGTGEGIFHAVEAYAGPSPSFSCVDCGSQNIQVEVDRRNQPKVEPQETRYRAVCAVDETADVRRGEIIHLGCMTPDDFVGPGQGPPLPASALPDGPVCGRCRQPLEEQE